MLYLNMLAQQCIKGIKGKLEIYNKEAIIKHVERHLVAKYEREMKNKSFIDGKLDRNQGYYLFREQSAGSMIPVKPTLVTCSSGSLIGSDKEINLRKERFKYQDGLDSEGSKSQKTLLSENNQKLLTRNPSSSRYDRFIINEVINESSEEEILMKKKESAKGKSKFSN